ncbi:hypothetical protein J9874_02222 [Duffyella gerundensis]|nr:hypothetical protein J9874_02222 [Duffyella gerundensis]
MREPESNFTRHLKFFQLKILDVIPVFIHTALCSVAAPDSGMMNNRTTCVVAQSYPQTGWTFNICQ